MDEQGITSTDAEDTSAKTEKPNEKSKKRRPTIQVIDRATSLLDALTSNEPPVSLKILAADSGLHPATAYRILTSLCENGFIERDDRGRYQLGLKFLQLSSRTRVDINIQREARPVMEWLRDRTGETVNLSVREGNELVYVERVSSPHTVRAEQVIGKRAPLHVTAVGKLMLGELGDAFYSKYVNDTGLPALTRRTKTTTDDLSTDVRRSLNAGYGLDDQEAEDGVSCIGVVVRDASGKPIAGLSVSSPVERHRSDQWAIDVQSAGQRLSERLGHARV